MTSRIALKENESLYLNRTYMIEKEIARGSTCIVYNAYYYDILKQKHYIRLKEFYPKSMTITRYHQKLQYEDEKMFKKAYDAFLLGYQNNVNFQNKVGLSNYTTQAFDIVNANNTCYLLIAYEDGISYDQYKEPSFHSLVKHMISLCDIIEKYHQYEYLHLDLKPDNILVLYDNHQLKLLDFDTITSINHPIPSTYNAYSALEQKYQQEVTYATDLFSIGAIFFEKLYHQLPSIMDCHIHSKYDHYSPCFDLSLLSLKAKIIIQDIFHHTLAKNKNHRYQNGTVLKNKFEQLLEFTDFSKVSLCSNFEYDHKHFIGRKQELKFLFDHFKIHSSLFIEGIGGIGKSELVKKYMQLSDYEYKYFLTYHHSIFETIIDDEQFTIINDTYDESIDKQTYFYHKLEILKQLSRNHKVFIVLDNFDVEDDPHIGLFLQLNVHKIITTRNHFSDFNVFTLKIHPFKDEQEHFTLFQCYNNIEYDSSQKQALKQLFYFFEYHTMSIELLAKHLRIRKINPTQLHQQLLHRLGITQLDKQQLALNKDQTFYRQSLKHHFEILFDFSSFDDQALLYLRSLSLLGAIYIDLNLFCEWMQIDINDACLWKLIDQGWIKYENHKLHLHQIILDLIYEKYLNDQKVDDTFVASLCQWMNIKTNQNDRNLKKRLLTIIFDRIEDNQAKINLYIHYLNNIQLDLNICESLIELCSLYQYEADYAFYSIKYCIIHLHQRKWNNFDYDEELNELCIKYSTFIHKALACTIHLDIKKQLDLLNIYHQLLDDIALEFSIINFKEYPYFMQLINDFIQFAYEIDELLEYEDIDDLCKKQYYFMLSKAMVYDYLTLTLDDNLFLEHIAHFKNKAYEIEETFTFDFEEQSFYDLAQDAFLAQDYKQALAYYLKSYEYEKEIAFNIEDEIAQCYEYLGQYEEAIAMYLKLSEYFYNDCYLKISKIYQKLQNFDQAMKYLKLHLDYLSFDPNSSNIDIIHAYLQEVLLLETFGKINDEAKNKLRNYYIHTNDFIHDDLLPFYLWYIDDFIAQNNIKEANKYRFLCAKIYYRNMEYESSFHICQSILETSNDTTILCHAYIMISILLLQNDQKLESIQAINQAYDLCENSHLIYFLEHLYSYAYEDEQICFYHMKQCDYLKLVPYFIEAYSLNDEKQSEAWNWAITRLQTYHQYEQAQLAYSHLLKISNSFDLYCNQIENALCYDHVLALSLLNDFYLPFNDTYDYMRLSLYFHECNQDFKSITCLMFHCLIHSSCIHKEDVENFYHIDLNTIEVKDIDPFLKGCYKLLTYPIEPLLKTKTEQFIQLIEKQYIDFK